MPVSETGADFFDGVLQAGHDGGKVLSVEVREGRLPQPLSSPVRGPTAFGEPAVAEERLAP